MSIFFLIIIVVDVYCLGPGSTSLAFLKIGPSAREISMGESAVAISENADSVYWNPARIYLMKTVNVSATYTLWFENIYYGSVFFTYPFKDSTLGISLNYLGMDEIDVYDDDGNFLNSKYTAYDFLATFSYAKGMVIKNKKILLGGSLKIIQEGIEKEKANIFAFDVGSFFQLVLKNKKKKTEKKIDFGIAIQNIGTETKFKNEGFPLPLLAKFGSCYRPKNNILLGVDLRLPIDNSPSLHIGFEYLIKNLLALRTGFKTLSISDLGFLSGLSIGFGIKIKNLGFDYAFVPYGELGYTHRFSFNIKF